MFRTARCACLFALLGLAPTGVARAVDQLAPSSPFLPPATAGTAAAENTPLELRGILVDEGGYRFSIFDPVRHTGTWARVNEPGHEFVIRAYDVAHDLVTLDYQGRVLSLPLRTAKVTAAAAGQVASGPVGNGPAGSGGPTVVLNPTPADEVARFNRVKEEIARRRALREQAGNQPPQLRK